jgi:hypothetical protein
MIGKCPLKYNFSSKNSSYILCFDIKINFRRIDFLNKRQNYSDLSKIRLNEKDLKVIKYLIIDVKIIYKSLLNRFSYLNQQKW